MILTDEKGAPFERPVPPPRDASVEERIAYVRARHAFHEEIIACGNRAFAREFRKKVKP